jgi:hypothetical protein
VRSSERFFGSNMTTTATSSARRTSRPSKRICGNHCPRFGGVENGCNVQSRAASGCADAL